MFENFNIKLGIYFIIAAIIVLYGTNVMNDMYQALGALIYFVGSLYVCIIYGARWFSTSTDKPTWPPIINSCPDYLTYYERTIPGGTEKTCIDTIGVANGTVLKQWPKDGTVPRDNDSYFSLVTTTDNANGELCARAMAAGLRWEGITNGDGCISSDGTPGNAGSSAKCS